MSRFFALIALVLSAFAVFAMPASAQSYPPRPNTAVYDGANILSPQTEAQLNAELSNYNQSTGRAIVVATVPSLEGQPIESYATGLFNNWGIGGDERDMGLLLLIAPNERKMRIEVGYGLHPYFGGIMSGRVIRDVITPRFKAGDYDGGVTAGVAAIIQHLNRSPADAKAVEEAAAAQKDAEQEGGGFPLGALLWLGFMFFVFVLPLIRGRRAKRYRGSGVGRDIGTILLWEGANAALNIAMRSGGSSSYGGGGFGGFGGGGGGFGGFGGGMSGGGGASGSW